MSESEASKKHDSADNDSFEWLHIYSSYDLDPSLREEPIKYYKQQMFRNMVLKDQQGKDTRIVVPVSLLIAVLPALVPLPRFDTQGSYYFLSTAFQGFSAMLGLLAIALVYRLQQMRGFQVHALEELRQFLAGLGLSTHSNRAVELWTEALGQLKRQAEKKKAGVAPRFLEYLQIRVNYCTRLEFDDAELHVQSSLCANMTETPTPPAITDLSGGGEMRHHGRRFEAHWRFPHDRVGSAGAEGGGAERALP